MGEIKFGDWVPYNPKPHLSKGTKMKHYIFRQDSNITAKQMGEVLDHEGFKHPIYYRINKVIGNKYIEFMCVAKP